MGAIKSSLILTDGMTPALRKITKAMTLVIDSFYACEKASGQAFNTQNLNEARQLFGQADAILDNMAETYKTCNEQQEKLNQKLSKGSSAANGLWGKIKGAATAYLGMKGVQWIRDSLSLFDTQNKAETQLKTVLRNNSASPEAFSAIQTQASALQGKTMYGDEALLGGAAEFSTYMTDEKAIAVMMDTLTNYAAGMSGGGEVGYKEMVDYATGLGKVMTGSYDAMTQKGFAFTEQQKAIIKNGTDMEKALVISDVINESWEGLAARMANTPHGQITQMKNTFGDMREELAARIYPAVMQFFQTINQNMPGLQSLIAGLAPPINAVLNIVTLLTKGLAAVCNVVTNNWSWIAPIIYGIAAALGVYIIATKGVALAQKVATIASGAFNAVQNFISIGFGVLTGNTAAASAAQFTYNSALMACPLTWILIVIIAVIVAIYAIVAGINKLTGSTTSATGIILGTICTAAAYIWNQICALFELILGVIERLINPFIRIANFIYNVFRDPVGAVIKLFGSMADGVLATLQKIASAMDFVFKTHMGDTIQGWRDNLAEQIEAATQEYGNGKYKEVVSTLNLTAKGLTLDYKDTWNAGYSAGESVDNAVGNFFGKGSTWDFADITDGMDWIAADTDEIAYNTGKSGEELAYLRDIAEKEAINRFTTAEVKIDMTGMTNRIDSNMDIDGVIGYLTDGLAEALATAGEGVY